MIHKWKKITDFSAGHGLASIFALHKGGPSGLRYLFVYCVMAIWALIFRFLTFFHGDSACRNGPVGMALENKLVGHV